MDGRNHIPAEEFAAALEGLDCEELAAFVGDLWRGTAEEVHVEGPVVTVRRGTEEVQLLAGTGDTRSGTGESRLSAGTDGPERSLEGVDAVVTTEEGSARGHPSVGPSELRERLLYGCSPDEADALCERHLDRAARSPDYPPDATERAATVGAGGRESGESPTTRGAADRQPENSSATGRVEDRRPGDPSDPTGELLVGTRFEPFAGRAGSQVVLVGALVALVLATSATAVFVGGLVSGDTGDAGGEAAIDADTPTAAPEAGSANTATPTVDVETEERDWGGWEAIPNGLPNSGETATPTATNGEEETVRNLSADRYADLAPTCNRSFLHVVQIQMNALKYNDNETNDGIRTVRRFASPGNREAVGSFRRFVQVVQSEPYAPMLDYDSAEYAPRRPSEDTARVRVVTRVDGNVTARYVFRLRKQEGGEYDGCWMTEGVQPLTDSSGSDVE